MNEELYKIPKTQAGRMAYAINLENEYVRLVEDLPEKGGNGAQFSTESVSFDVINQYISSRNHGIDGVFLADMFESPRTINNGTMLLAALCHLECVDYGGNFLQELSRDMELPEE